jgi:hypothetical protein
MARCYAELGRYARAVEIYHRLLQSHPTYSHREGVEQAQTELQARIADQEEADNAPSRGPTVIAGGNAYVFGGGDTFSRFNGGDIDNQSDVHVQATRMTRGRKISWSVLASGLAITAIGAGLLIRRAVLRQEFDEAASGFATSDEAGRKSIHNDLTEMAETGQPLLGAGWGLTISGLAISCASILLLAFIPGEELIPSGSGSRANVHLSLTGFSFTGSF